MRKKANKNEVASQAGDKMFASLADLTPDPANARKHNPRNVGMLVDSLHQVGAARSIVVDENGVVLAGNATIEAAAEAGIHRVKAVEADGSEIVAVVRRGLSKEQKTKLALYDNRVAELAEWNPEILAELTETKELEGMFSDKELAEILTQTGIEPKDAEPQIDKAEELRQKWGTESGQLWVIGNHRLLVGDSTNKADVGRLCAEKQVDMILTDPPYGMDLDPAYDSMFQGDKRHRKTGERFNAVRGDDAPYDPRPLMTHFDAVKEQFWFGADYYCERIPNLSSGVFIVWDKRCSVEMDRVVGNVYELAWSRQPHKKQIARVLWSGHHGMQGDTKSRLHPTQKPVALYAWFFDRWGKQGDVIVDFYSGVGGLIVAAENANRSAYCIEMDAGFVACSLERMTTAFPHLKIEKVDQARAA